MEEQYRAVIGPLNREYYLSYFHRADSRGYAPISWHWPALFFALPWLLWRRQYRWAGITILVQLVAVQVGAIAASSGNPELARPLATIIALGYGMVFLPLKANAIYYTWAQRRIRYAQAQQPGQPQRQMEWLARRGGVNRNLPIYMVLLSMLLVALGQLAPPPPASVSEGTVETTTDEAAVPPQRTRPATPR